MVKLIVKIIKWVIIVFFVSTILSVIVYRFIPVSFTPLMFIRAMENLSEGKNITWKHEWKPLNKISPHLPVAVMASEDQRFLIHHGFDYEAIQRAINHNKKHINKQGASTISQQTAKNVFLWNGRSWVRKGLEAYFTFLIEMLWSKQRIMEVYLNSIEMGTNIYGAEAVAEAHFNKSAELLTRAECALIAATLPNPRIYSSENPSVFIRKRQQQIQNQMKFIPSFPKEGEKHNPNTVRGGIYKH